MTAMQPVSDNNPLMLAWKAHKKTDEYANSKRWAAHEQHLVGSLWALFAAGWNSANKIRHEGINSAGGIYLSGPMSGLPEHNFPAFNEAARLLRQRGHAVTNPAEINVGSEDGWHACMRSDIKALCDCSSIALLPGWEKSSGAQLELHIAHRLGLDVMMLADLLEVKLMPCLLAQK